MATNADYGKRLACQVTAKNPVGSVIVKSPPTVPIGPLPPALTTEAAQALGVRDVMGLYTAPFSATTQRTANVKRAAEITVLLGGKSYSAKPMSSASLLYRLISRLTNAANSPAVPPRIS